MHVRLLGPPSIVGDDGSTLDVRGQKPWALLGRLLVADRPLTRRELSAELFPETVDPLGSLRWTLASLRKAFGIADLFTGDPVSPELPPGVTVDIAMLADGVVDPTQLGEFLQGVDPPCGPEFATWLLVARQQVAARVDAALHDRVVIALSRGDNERAVGLAEAAARRSPYDERVHVLLVTALTACGLSDAAASHVDMVETLFRREFGTDPSPALRSAARPAVAATPPGVSAGTQAVTLLDAGRAALAAGAVDAGVDCLRRATAEAERAADGPLLTRCLLELGSALVHSVRGYDDEGGVMLEHALVLAEEHGERNLFVTAMRERAYTDALAGRRSEADRRLRIAAASADGDAGLLAGIEAIIAFNLADWGRKAEGVDHFETSIELARSAGDRRREAWSLGVGAWAVLDDGRIGDAARWSDDCLVLVRDLQWMSFEPWPIAVREEAGLVGGVASGGGRLEQCFALACQLGDPCWQGAAGRLIALDHSLAGRHDEAVRWIVDAGHRARSATDTWAAMVGTIMVTEADLRAAAGDDQGARLAARDAIAFTARAQLDGLLARAIPMLSR